MIIKVFHEREMGLKEKSSLDQECCEWAGDHVFRYCHFYSVMRGQSELRLQLSKDSRKNDYADPYWAMRIIVLISSKTSDCLLCWSRYAARRWTSWAGKMTTKFLTPTHFFLRWLCRWHCVEEMMDEGRHCFLSFDHVFNMFHQHDPVISIDFIRSRFN